ncbi:PREDICTED: glutaredoxin-C6-like [Nelumbo nucifera]|uniref:Glutaredoxin-C6-like n=1 Tax=Nelumbo nucifera TaxID=4432 RepID=A0A1U7YT16_NELNU|nr:PREDICTED: glutaredoxin-C6-like [Nelumbo nucifera]
MQGVRRFRQLSGGGVKLDLTATATATATKGPLSIDGTESVEKRIERLVSENPVIIFSRSSCYMCHVMKKLLSTIGVHPTVIELDEGELGVLAALYSTSDGEAGGGGGGGGAPAVFIGGKRVGGLESLMGLHLSGHLVPKLREVGALWV